MDNLDIMGMVSRHLENTGDINEALFLSQKEIANRLIDGLVDKSFDRDFLKILRMVVDTRGRLSFFLSLVSFDGGIFGFTEKKMKMFLDLYYDFKKIADFLYLHYDSLDFGQCPEEMTKENARLLVEHLTEMYPVYSLQFKKTRRIALNKAEFRLVGLTCDIAYCALLGHERFIKLAEGLHNANIVLKKIQTELTPNQS